MGAREIFKHKRICVIFQPHTYSRTAKFFDDFVKVLNRADALILFKTYPARENKNFGKSAEDLYLEIKKQIKHNKKCKKTNKKPIFYAKTEKSLFKILETNNIFENYKVIFMGAGDLCERLKAFDFWMCGDEI